MSDDRFKQIEAIFLDFDEDQWDQKLKEAQVNNSELQEYEQELTNSPFAQKILAILRKRPAL